MHLHSLLLSRRYHLTIWAFFLPILVHAAPFPGVYQPYQPRSEDGYVQIWNLNFQGKGYSIDLIYMISNVGPGALNNGISMLVHSAGQSRSFTREHTDESLEATPGQFGFRNLSGELKMTPAGIEAIAEFDQAKIRLQMSPGRQGILMPDWKLQDDEFFRIGLPVLRSGATVRLEIGGEVLQLEGVAGMDSIVANTLPHRYANRLFLFRGASGMFQMTGFLDRNSVYQLKLYRGVGSNLKEESITGVTEEGLETDAFSQFQLARIWKLKAASGCNYELRRGAFRGGMYVLQSVSPFLRWILKTFFARPFILNFESTVTSSCPGEKPVTEALWASYFLLND